MASPSAIETLDFRPSMRQTMVITRKSLETEGKVSRVEIDLEPGQGGPPAHVHSGQQEFYSVDDGELAVTIDGDTRIISPGKSVEVPTGSSHTFANRSDRPVRFSAEHLPALRFEEYIRLVHRTVAGRKATLPTILRIVRIESSYGDTILAPRGIPRVMSKVMSGVGMLLGYPSGDELAATSKQRTLDALDDK